MDDIFNIEKIKQKFSLNRSRSKMLVSLFRAILDVGSENLYKLSFSVKSTSQQLSVYRRIQRFFASVKLCDLECAKLIFAILSINREDKLILILDRTYWMRGIVHLNFLYLSLFYNLCCYRPRIRWLRMAKVLEG